MTLSNPIASDLAAMRVSLWPGLLRVALENLSRQQDRVRLFERGVRFVAGVETDTLSGIACGPRAAGAMGHGQGNARSSRFLRCEGRRREPARWNRRAARRVHVRTACARLPASRARGALESRGQACWLDRRAASRAWCSELGFTYPPVLFELDYTSALAVVRPAYREFSRFPRCGGTLRVVVDEGVSLSALRERVVLAAPSLLKACLPFDVYRGPGVETGRKSIALGLIFQDISRTLTDEDIDGAVAAILAELRASLNAKIRE